MSKTKNIVIDDLNTKKYQISSTGRRMNIFHRVYLFITDYPLYRMIYKQRWDSELDEFANRGNP